MESMNRSTKQGATLLEKLGVLIVGILFILALLAGIVALVFYATGHVDPTALRWWATVLTLIYLPSIIVTWRIAKREAKEHLKGFSRGLDGAQQTLLSLGRGLSATASIARSTKPAPVQPTTPQIWGVQPVQPLPLTYRTARPNDTDDL